MGRLSRDEMKSKMYKALSKVNDRAFSLITIFSISTCITALSWMLKIQDKISLTYAFIALVCLVVSTILSSAFHTKKWLREVSATLCMFLWLFVANLSGVLQNSNAVYAAAFYAVLFWSNINLLGVFLNGRK
jgi:hypothetical protein